MSAVHRTVPAWRRVLERALAFEPSPRVRKVLRIAGYPAFGVLVFLVAFSASLPRDKVREQLETMLSQDPTTNAPLGLGMDVSASDLNVSLLGSSITAENVVLRTRPLRTADKAQRFLLDKLKVSVGLIGLALQRPAYKFAIEAFEGTLDGKISTTLTDSHYTVKGESLHLADVQGLQTAIGGLPLEGTLAGTLDLDAPGRLLATSNGTLEIDLDGAALGDDKAKLIIPGDPFLSAGVTVPKVKLGKVVASLVVEKGKARIESFRARSADLDLTIEGYLDLRDPLSLSQLHLFVRFKLSDDLLKRDATLGLVTSGLQNGKRGDGFYGAQLTGLLASPRFEPNKSPPAGVISKFESGAAAAATPAAATPTPAAPAAVPAPTPAPAPVVDAATPAPAPEMPAPPDRQIPNGRSFRALGPNLTPQGPPPGSPPSPAPSPPATPQPTTPSPEDGTPQPAAE